MCIPFQFHNPHPWWKCGKPYYFWIVYVSVHRSKNAQSFIFSREWRHRRHWQSAVFSFLCLQCRCGQRVHSTHYTPKYNVSVYPKNKIHNKSVNSHRLVWAGLGSLAERTTPTRASFTFTAVRTQLNQQSQCTQWHYICFNCLQNENK